MALLALLFGGAALIATLLPIWSTTRSELVWTTVGLTAVYFGLHHFARRRRGLARGRLMASVGIGFGAAATALLIWGVLWSTYPTLPSPPQVAFARSLTPPQVAAPPAVPSSESAQSAEVAADHSYEQRAGRVVPPTPNAREVEPAYQLQTNLVALAYEICVAIGQYREQYGALPVSLAVGDAGEISTEGGTFSAVLPAYMRMSFDPAAPDGSAFLTVADTESGMAMSCVRSGDEVWIANN